VALLPSLLDEKGAFGVERDAFGTMPTPTPFRVALDWIATIPDAALEAQVRTRRANADKGMSETTWSFGTAFASWASSTIATLPPHSGLAQRNRRALSSTSLSRHGR
jgi:hypothetical protein